MTEAQWRDAWALCESAAELEPDVQLNYIQGYAADPEVEDAVLAVYDDLRASSHLLPISRHTIGETVEHYVLEQRIGQGGMGEVYLAADTELHRQVALKFLGKNLPITASVWTQMIREARAASALNHPNIVTIYEIVQKDSGLGIVMEYIDGQSLRDLIRSKRCSRQEVLQLGIQIASALAAAHRKNIVHRDVKPENIMVRQDGYVKVLDFGLAHRMRPNSIEGSSVTLPVGTIRYMSPEQKSGKELTGASDVYSLALVLEELGTWRHSLLTEMKAQEPQRRPSAEQVVIRLQKLEKSRRQLTVGIAALLALLVVSVIAAQWQKWFRQDELRFEQITHKSSGHDIAATSISPDGKQLAYVTADGGLFLRNTQTGFMRELNAPPVKSISQLLFSSSGLLALSIGKDVAFEIWSIPVNGQAPFSLLTGVESAAISHDGTQLAWLTWSTHQVWIESLVDRHQHLLFTAAPNEHLPLLSWSANDHRLWFLRMHDCPSNAAAPDPFVDPVDCHSDDLSTWDEKANRFHVRARNLHPRFGFFTSNGEFFYLRDENVRGFQASCNLWSFRADRETDMVVESPRQLSHLTGIRLSQLSGSNDGKSFAMVRTDRFDQTYVADWHGGSEPALLHPRRLTLEMTNNFPHAWTPDNQSVIFESDRNIYKNLFSQKLAEREAETLVSTPDDKWMPQVSPDSRWILFASFDRTRPDYSLHDLHRLKRSAIQGGVPVDVGREPLDEFRCSLPGRGSRCVLRTTTSKEQIYFELDPVRGKGPELGRTSHISTGIGQWALSADGTVVAIPDRTRDGQFTELHLSINPAERSEGTIHTQVPGLINGMNPVPSGDGWLVWGRTRHSTTERPIMPTFMLHRSRMEGLYWVDRNRNAKFLYRSLINTYGVFAPDEKHIAFLGIDLDNNIVTFQR